jgi:hypothetical protein
MLAMLLAVSLELSSPQAQRWYDDLLAQGGYGRFQREHAAFLIRERDGSLTLEPWTHSGFRHASFRGVIPARTIAILHTHPEGDPDPSSGDRAEARRLGLPVVVITPGSVIAADPSAGRTRVLSSGRNRAPSVRRTLLPR